MVSRIKQTLAWFAPGGDRLPDFLCIGAQRAGTTLLHQLLGDHPDIHLPPCKELHALDAMAGIEPERWAQFREDFLAAVIRRSWRAGPAAGRKRAWARRFARTGSLDMAWYASLFREARPDQRAGDVTPSYALLPDTAVDEVVARMPDLHVFFLLRDPVERALSGAIHACTLAVGETRAPNSAALAAALADPGCLARSRYRPTIERWEARLAPARFHVLLFDDLVADPDSTIARICAALGIAAPRPAGRRPPVNANSIAADWPFASLHDLASALVEDSGWVAARFGGPTIDWARRVRTLAATPEASPS